MYDEFNKLISLFSQDDGPSDYWYDCAMSEAENLLEKFNDADWHLLINNLDNQSLAWKKRLIDCFGTINTYQEINIILKLISENDDDDLYFSSVEALRSLDFVKLDHLQKELLLSKMIGLLDDASERISALFEEVAGKIVRA